MSEYLMVPRQEPRGHGLSDAKLSMNGYERVGKCDSAICARSPLRAG